jgi:hypothetical protein
LEHLKNFKIGIVLYLGLKLTKPNPSRETVPLNSFSQTEPLFFDFWTKTEAEGLNMVLSLPPTVFVQLVTLLWRGFIYAEISE